MDARRYGIYLRVLKSNLSSSAQIDIERASERSERVRYRFQHDILFYSVYYINKGLLS